MFLFHLSKLHDFSITRSLLFLVNWRMIGLFPSRGTLESTQHGFLPLQYNCVSRQCKEDGSTNEFGEKELRLAIRVGQFVWGVVGTKLDSYL